MSYKKILGIDIGEKSVKLALVSQGNVIKTVCAELPDRLVQNGHVVSVETMSEIITKTMRENGISCRHAAMILTGDNVFTGTFLMPDMTHEQLKVNLPFEFRDYITDELKNYTYNYTVLEIKPGETPGNDILRILGVAAPTELVREYSELARKCGLKLERLAPGVNAVTELARRRKADDEKEYCVLDIGQRSARMHIFKGDEFVVTRIIENGMLSIEERLADELGVDVHLAHTYMITNYQGCAEGETCTQVFERISMEIMRSLNFYQFSNPDNKLERLYLTGGGAEIPALEQRIRQAVDLPIYSAEELLPMFVDQPETYCLAIGITFFDTQNNPNKVHTRKSINLVRKDVQALNWKILVPSSLVIIMLAILLSKFTVVNLINERNQAEGEVQILQSKLNSYYDEIASYEELADTYSHYTYSGMNAEEITSVSRETILNLIRDKVMPYADVRSWEVTYNTLVLPLTGEDLQAINRIVQGLNEDERVDFCTVTTAKTNDLYDSEGAVTAQITIYLKAEQKGVMRP